MYRSLKIAVLALAVAAFTVTQPGIAEAGSKHRGGHHGSHYKGSKSYGHYKGHKGYGHHKGHKNHGHGKKGYKGYKYHAGYKHHKHGHGHGHGYYWWPFAVPLAAAVTGALLTPFYAYNYYAPPPPPARRPCHPATVQELNYYRQPVLVTRIVCYDSYGNGYIAR